MFRDQFLEGMSHAAATVSVVTTDGPKGRAGITVSAMCSVSADPPSLLVCVHHMSQASEAVKQNGAFCVNVLRDDQAYISDTFAGRIKAPNDDKFACAEWRTQKTGAPALIDALVAFDCRLKKHIQWGSHHVFIADIVDIASEDSGHPLIYANRAYGTSVQLDTFAKQSYERTEHKPAARKQLTVGCFVTLGPFFMPRLIRGFIQERPDVEVQLREGVQDSLLQGLENGRFELALLYDVGLSRHLHTELLAEVPPHALLPRAHPLAQGRSVSLRDLAAEPMVLLDIPPSREYFTSLFGEFGLEPRIQYYSPSFEMVRGMVGNGLGYSLLVTKPANNMSYDGKALVSRPLAETTSPGRIVIAQLATAKLTPLSRTFVEYCKSFFCRFRTHKQRGRHEV